MAPQTAQKTVSRILFGHLLEHLRRRAKMSQADLAKLIGKPQSRIANLEDGQATATAEHLEIFVDVLKPDRRDEVALRELHAGAHKRGSWSTTFGRGFHEDFRLMVDLERHANLLQEIGSEIIPGLLQCEAYVRVIHEVGAKVDPALREERIQARLERQSVLLRSDFEYRVVLYESCLRRMIGSGTVMREQLEHLISLSESGVINLQVLTNTAKFEGGVDLPHSFRFVRVPTKGSAGPLQIAYVQSVSEIRYIDDFSAVAQYDKAFASASRNASRPDNSRRIIEHIAGTFL